MFVGTEQETYDKEFLKKLDAYSMRETYVKILSLDWDEHPVAEITGTITGGTITIDGSSKTRRTCSLTALVDSDNAVLNKAQWGLNTKFAVLVGLKNFVDNKYPDIVWFQQGIFILTSFSQTRNSSGNMVSIQGKDKMCLLDGTVGGKLFADHDFGKLEIIDTQTADQMGESHYDYILIYDIVRNLVHTYALEPYENIIIHDLDDIAVELLEYRLNDKKMYIYDVGVTPEPPKTEPETYTSQMAFEGIAEGKIFDGKTKADIGVWFPANGISYRLVKIVEFGDTAGYRRTDLTYAGDLVINAGNAVSGALDKIVEQLGEYEYYYDIFGRFIFQRKKIYHNVVWNGAITNNKNGTYYEQTSMTAEVYNFDNSYLIESYNNRPNYLNIRNDYICWGKTATGASIHLRYAIDDKPKEYHSLLTGEKLTSKDVDWRELIYQMAVDNSRSQEFINQLTYGMKRKMPLYHDKTATEYATNQYYYDTNDKVFKIIPDDEKFKELRKNHNFIFSTTLPEKYNVLEEIEEWQNTWNTGYDCYYADLLAFWHLIYDRRNVDELAYATDITEDQKQDRIKRIKDWENNGYWNPDLFIYNFDNKKLTFLNPGALLFWFDFIEDSSLAKYKQAIIGRRPEVVNDDKVQALFYEETPEVLFIDPTKEEDEESTLTYTKLNLVGGLSDYFIISGQGKSAKEELDSKLYDKTYFQESVTLSCLPIYYFEPNTRISINDVKSGINGKFIIQSISLPLEYGSMMSITATQLAERIL